MTGAGLTLHHPIVHSKMSIDICNLVWCQATGATIPMLLRAPQLIEGVAVF